MLVNVDGVGACQHDTSHEWPVFFLLHEITVKEQNTCPKSSTINDNEAGDRHGVLSHRAIGHEEEIREGAQLLRGGTAVPEAQEADVPLPAQAQREQGVVMDFVWVM